MYDVRLIKTAYSFGCRCSMKLSQLRSLVAVADTLNFGKASQYLEVSQSAISHAIAALEADLGIVLLRRGRYGARLTPVGDRIVNLARQMLALSEAIEQEAIVARGIEGGQVRIATFRSLATHILPKVMVQFQQAFPAIKVTISEYFNQAEAELALRRGEADVGLLHVPIDEEFESWKLFEDEYLALLPPNSTITNQSLTWSDFTMYPLILPSEIDVCGALIRQYFAEHQQKLEIAYEIKEPSTIVSMVEQGLGATVMARLVAEPISPRIRLHSLPVPLQRSVGVMILSEALYPPAVFVFLDLIKKMNFQGCQKLIPEDLSLRSLG